MCLLVDQDALEQPHGLIVADPARRLDDFPVQVDGLSLLLSIVPEHLPGGLAQGDGRGLRGRLSSERDNPFADCLRVPHLGDGDLLQGRARRQYIRWLATNLSGAAIGILRPAADV